ncbi:MAG TPA: MBL fold metallo-hydrolase [Prolixibacteraceae bacterium]|nr:MBL fold metallo-hydrolase [Prolixibacteraceae bacterium]HPR59849.1 MBL fold metallo-hydrolase [Prolixibacteraceae bacterium]
MNTLIKISLSLLIFIASLNLFAGNNETIKSAQVTYIANSGFIVKVGYNKVMFDGLFQNGMNRYLEPSEQTVDLIKNGLNPFDDIDLVFVSSFHADKFDPYVATQFMLHNKHVKMLAPQQVINKMKIFTADFPKIEKRIVETTPMANHYDRIILGDYEVFACNIKHEKIENDHVENIGFLVNVNGVKVFHSGDSDASTLSDLRGINLADIGVDIAFLNDKFGVGRAAKQTNKIVNARYNVLMHFEKYITNSTLDAFADKTKLHPKPHIFKIRNEYQDFYISDYEINSYNEDLSLTFLK